MITSANNSAIKYQESNTMIAKKGLPSLVQERIIVSDEEFELSKKLNYAYTNNIWSCRKGQTKLNKSRKLRRLVVGSLELLFNNNSNNNTLRYF
jgi:hypothetical protein